MRSEAPVVVENFDPSFDAISDICAASRISVEQI